jgi:hypothetical protein
MCPDAMLREQSHGLRAYAKSAQHALRQHDRSGGMIKQLSDVGGLNTRFVSGAGLIPIPFPCSARENLGVSESPDALDFDPPPSNRRDARRSLAAFSVCIGWDPNMHGVLFIACVERL